MKKLLTKLKKIFSKPKPVNKNNFITTAEENANEPLKNAGLL